MEFVVPLEVGKVIYVATSERKGIRSWRRNSLCTKYSDKLLSKGVSGPVVEAVTAIRTNLALRGDVTCLKGLHSSA